SGLSRRRPQSDKCGRVSVKNVGIPQHLTKSSLLSGLDAIRRANIDDYGRGFFTRVCLNCLLVSND
ncbi:hypothetical protein, partial [Vibrio cincinnatiensis]|uniref:hypothetical protein n=1 Tax=Vibrio cincinnatiensis TaxID=675 RepID=UPI001EDCFE62